MRCRIDRGGWAGTEIGFDEAGTGEALVLLHPFPLQRSVFAEQLPGFGALRRTFALDMPGFGDTTPAGPGAFNMDELADLVAAFLDTRRVPKATVLGISMGGYVALAFAERHPARLSGLVLADTRAAADSPETRAGRAGALAALEQHGAPPYLDNFVAQVIDPQRSRDAYLRARLLCEENPASLRAAIEALRDRPDRTKLLPTLSCPTLVLVGSEDKMTPPTEMRGMADAIPRATFKEIEGVGHFGCVEKPEVFQGAVVSFLESHGVRRAEELS